jgi:maltoporin
MSPGNSSSGVLGGRLKSEKSFRSLLFAAFIFLGAFSGLSSAWAVTGDGFDYHGYMRAGSGSNFDGGNQTCHNLAGVPGNEFRLGNECGIYGEAYFQAYTPNTKKADGEFFRANFDISYNPNGDNLNEQPNFGIFGAYIEAGRVEGIPETFWVGKRYYRDTDIHMDDFFYFADTSGNGAGVQDIPLANGKLAIAIMREDTQTNDPAVNGVASPVTTQNGVPRTLLFDVRLFQLPLDAHNQLNFWGGLATATGGTDPVSGVSVSNATGEVLGVKEQFQNDLGYNRATVIFGRGLMQGMNLGGFFGADPTQIMGEPYSQDAHRVRAVEEFVFQPSRQFATSFAAIYETWTINPAFQTGRWVSVGARPTYFFSEHYSLAFEAGAADAKLSTSNTTPSTPLVRFTLAPQLSPTSEFFSRPVLRAYITETTSASQGPAFGFQGEVWF